MAGKTSAPCLEGQSLSPTEAQCNPPTAAGSSGSPRDALVSLGVAFWRKGDKKLFIGSPSLSPGVARSRGAGGGRRGRACRVERIYIGPLNPVERIYIGPLNPLDAGEMDLVSGRVR
jgi:hypothetical protein